MLIVIHIKTPDKTIKAISNTLFVKMIGTVSSQHNL